MPNIRRYPGLRCERCGSDEFEIELTCNVSDDVIGGKDFEYELHLLCAHCPRVFPVCGIRKMSDVSEIRKQDCNWIESANRRKKFGLD